MKENEIAQPKVAEEKVILVQLFDNLYPMTESEFKTFRESYQEVLADLKR